MEIKREEKRNEIILITTLISTGILIELLAVSKYSNPGMYVSQGFKVENGTENVKVLFKGENQYEIVFAGGNSFCVCCYDPRIRAQKEGLA